MKKFIFTLVVLVAIAGGLGYLAINLPYSTGVRSGRLVKLSDKGVLIKTYEGTLDLGMGDNLSWDFSLHDEAMAKELLVNTGKMIQLDYNELYFKFFYGTKYKITKWQLADGSDSPFCRLVNLVRTSHDLVDRIRSLVQLNDPELMKDIRHCQSLSR